MIQPSAGEKMPLGTAYVLEGVHIRFVFLDQGWDLMSCFIYLFRLELFRSLDKYMFYLL